MRSQAVELTTRSQIHTRVRHDHRFTQNECDTTSEFQRKESAGELADAGLQLSASELEHVIART
eukprot:2761243-Rhodomonas_salina.1